MKKKIALVYGGNSSEASVSNKSATGLYSFFDHNRYDVYLVSIFKNEWLVQLKNNQTRTINKNDFSFQYNHKRIQFDFAYITIHGTPGENGLLQGYFDLIGLPYSTGGVLTSALTFNKYFCNKYLGGFGITVSKSLLVRNKTDIMAHEIAQNIGFPCFIKPNEGGSSLGVSKVTSSEQVTDALEKAFHESNEVLIEAFMPGREVTCGAYQAGEKITLLPVTEIVSHNEFFDYNAKYNQMVDELTPAPISDALTLQVQNLTETIYRILQCKGLVRIDFIIDQQNIIRLLEVNTTPGMTPTSIVPQQAKAAGLHMKDILSEIIDFHLT